MQLCVQLEDGLDFLLGTGRGLGECFAVSSPKSSWKTIVLNISSVSSQLLSSSYIWLMLFWILFSAREDIVYLRFLSSEFQFSFDNTDWEAAAHTVYYVGHPLSSFCNLTRLEICCVPVLPDCQFPFQGAVTETITELKRKPCLEKEYTVPYCASKAEVVALLASLRKSVDAN